jgi:hypothetical protein
MSYLYLISLKNVMGLQALMKNVANVRYTEQINSFVICKTKQQ